MWRVVKFAVVCLLSLVSGEMFLAVLFGYVAYLSGTPWIQRVIYGLIVAAFTFFKSFQIGRASLWYFH